LLPGAFQSKFKTATAQVALPTLIFGTQPPFGEDFISINAVFGNHQPRTGLAPRGGDLGSLLGFDQINARLPRSLAGRGEVEVGLSVEGKAANVVKVSIK